MVAVHNQLGRHPEVMPKSFAEHPQLIDAVKVRDTKGRPV